MTYCAVLDANVLYPSLLRSVLIGIGQTGIYRPRWTKDINEEWIRNLIENRADLDTARVRRTADLMNRAIRDALIEGYETLIPCVELPEPDDRHVLAAAIKGKADGIVTFNLKHFPADILEQYELQPIHPDDFLINQLDINQSLVLEAIHRQRMDLNKSLPTPEMFIARLEKDGLPQTAARLRPMCMLI